MLWSAVAALGTKTCHKGLQARNLRLLRLRRCPLLRLPQRPLLQELAVAACKKTWCPLKTVTETATDPVHSIAA